MLDRKSTTSCLPLIIITILEMSLPLLIPVDVYTLQDLLYVISYGPSQVKPPAVQMLFHYWPNLKPPGAIIEYRGLQYTGQTL